MIRRPSLVDLVLVAGLAAAAVAHARLYLDGYRFIPAVGPGFLVFASVSAALAVLILAGGPRWLRVMAALASAGAVVAFALSRTVGLLGFIEQGWEPHPYAAVSLVAEIVVMVLGASTLWRPLRHR